MNQNNETFYIRTIYEYLPLPGIHLDYSLGEEAALFAPPRDGKLLFGAGYNSKKSRQSFGMPYHTTKQRAYRRWIGMLQRCYTVEKAAYDDCTVCAKWHDYQEFADWFVEQPYSSAADAELDKDILDPLNTMYSPEFCSVVPKLVNQIFRNTRSQRGVLPLGVYETRNRQAVVARLSMHGKQVHLGTFNDIIKAFEECQDAHWRYCNELADIYETQIDARVIERLRRYKRHIRD